jgi:hypothetical protein
MTDTAPSLTPEQDKYLAWFADAKTRGLLSVDFTFTEAAEGANSEERYAELNRMHDAPDLPAKGVLSPTLMLTSTITFPSDSDHMAYLNSFKEGDRVVETSRSAFFGKQGDIYYKDTSPCVRWDPFPGETASMGTSVTGGTRHLSDTNLPSS